MKSTTLTLALLSLATLTLAKDNKKIEDARTKS
jgi:hypothetical protein